MNRAEAAAWFVMISQSPKEVFFCWALIRPADDVPGEWVGHCLDMDVVSQGNSPREAIAMLFEATALVATDDMSKGRNPLERRAPAECWQEVERIQESGCQVQNLDEFLSRPATTENRNLAIVMQFKMQVDLRTHEASEPRRLSRVPALAVEHHAAC